MENNKRLLLGILLVLAGTLLLLRNLDVLPEIPDFVFSWPSLFIVIALFNLISGNRGAAVIFGGLGAFFYVQRYSDWDWHTYWPIIIMIVGLSLLLNSGRRKHSGTSDTYFDDMNVFGGGDKRFNSQELMGGKITNIFGGADIDLREAKAVNGAKIEVFTLFGGCDILVPDDWNVVIDTTSIFGAFNDKRIKGVQRGDTTVYIKGTTIFGGGEVKSSK